jgi:hypothetical protein
MSHSLYQIMTRFGDYYPLNIKGSTSKIINKLEDNFTWIQYNPRKNIDRYGLSITSLDGGLSGRPDLDSLLEHYKKTGIWIDETEINVKTEVYNYFKPWLDPIESFLGRTHVIKLNQGAYFPPHRDNRDADIRSFRLFMPLNYDSASNFFLLENDKMEFDNGKMYFIDTCKMHTLFNTSNTPFYFVVVNVILSEESVKTTLQYLYG